MPEIRDAGRTQCVYGMFSFTPDANSLIGEVHGVTGSTCARRSGSRTVLAPPGRWSN